MQTFVPIFSLIKEACVILGFGQVFKVSESECQYNSVRTYNWKSYVFLRRFGRLLHVDYTKPLNLNRGRQRQRYSRAPQNSALPTVFKPL